MKNLLLFEDFNEVLILEKNIPTNKYKKLERPRIGVIHEEDPLTGIATPKRDVQITFCLK